MLKLCNELELSSNILLYLICLIYLGNNYGADQFTTVSADEHGA